MDPCLFGGKLEKCHPLTWLCRSLWSHLSPACATTRDSSICGSKICPFLWILLLTFPDTFARVIFKPLATIRVATTIFVFRQKVEPILDLSGVAGTSFLIPSPLVGRLARTCIILSVWLLLVIFVLMVYPVPST